MSGKKKLNDNQLFKRQRVRDARQIRTESIKNDREGDVSEAGGMLQVGNFINSRRYEIQSLQMAMKSSKSSSSTRVFQALPRKLRRRTASHNVRRIPKRMRNRALREMKKSNIDDNKGKNATTEKKPAKSKYKAHGLTKRQLYKIRMAIKLLRLASRSTSLQLALPRNVTLKNTKIRNKINTLKKTIKSNSSRRLNSQALNNKMGSYDNIGINSLASAPKMRVKYLKRQRFFTWLPSHIWNAKRSHMMKRWGYQIPWSPTQKCFKLTHRLGGSTAASDGALCMDSSFFGTMILEASNPESQNELDKLAGQLTANKVTKQKYKNGYKWYEGIFYDPSQNFDNIIGIGEIMWITDSKLLIRLHPALYGKVFDELCATYSNKIKFTDSRFALASFTVKGAKALTAIASVMRSAKPCESYKQLLSVAKLSDDSILPKYTMFAFDAIDPRYLSKPQLPNVTCDLNQITNNILNIQKSFPKEEISMVFNKLADSTSRYESYRNQHTLKMIAKKKSIALRQNSNKTGTSNLLPFNDETDPKIPISIIKREKSDDWLVILPWFWFLPYWHQINKISKVYHIGLRQVQQLQYEKKQLYFPDDFPFTKQGYLENSVFKRESSYARWQRKPLGKRVNYEKIRNIHSKCLPTIAGELGDPFSCDWKLLQILRNGLKFLSKQGTPIQYIDEKRTGQFDDNQNRIVRNVNDLFELYKDVKDNADIDSPTLPIQYRQGSKAYPAMDISKPDHILNVPLSITPISATLIDKGRPSDNSRIYSIPDQDLNFWKQVAGGVYQANGKRLHEQQIPKPELTNLIGFATSGTFHLGLGRGMINGFIDSEALRDNKSRFVLIRNTGTDVYRLAKWESISI